MIKLIGKNSIYLVGKINDIRLHLASIENKSMTLAEYLKQETLNYRNSLN
jgi:hypothetical protein